MHWQHEANTSQSSTLQYNNKHVWMQSPWHTHKWASTLTQFRSLVPEADLCSRGPRPQPTPVGGAFSVLCWERSGRYIAHSYDFS